MNYSYEGSGIIEISGCSQISIKKNFIIEFPLRTRVWIKDKAKKGILESVVIKRINAIPPEEEWATLNYQPIINYVDSFNRVWLEDELIIEAEAIDLSTAYFEYIDQLTRRKFEEDGCVPFSPEE